MDMEFIRIIRPIVKTENYKSMKKFNHHKHFSTYYHSIKVAYIAYNYAKKHKLKIYMIGIQNQNGINFMDLSIPILH